MAKRQVLYQHTFVVHVLTEKADYEPVALGQLLYDITGGPDAGTFGKLKRRKLVGLAAVQRCLELACDPAWFDMDDQGYAVTDLPE